MTTNGNSDGEALRTLRVRNRLTQAALAYAIGVSAPTVNAWENGRSRISNLSRNAIRAWAEGEGVELPVELAGEKR